MHDWVRPATPYDAAALHRIAALTFPLGCTPHTPEEEKAAFVAEHLSADAFAAYLADADRVLLVAQPGGSGELVGYTMLVAGEPDDADVADALRARPTTELSKMYVDPAHHGGGVAARLMTAALEAARRTGAAGVWLGVSEENARANAFYARHGFEQVGRKRFRIGDRWEDDFVRERVL
jgi:diamine N-acetyltransferase